MAARKGHLHACDCHPQSAALARHNLEAVYDSTSLLFLVNDLCLHQGAMLCTVDQFMIAQCPVGSSVTDIVHLLTVVKDGPVGFLNGIEMYAV